MPTYEYECSKCGHRFDLFRKMTDSEIQPCPACGASSQRLISSGSGFIFKGSGFYATDYKNKTSDKDRKCDPGGKSDGCKSCPMSKE